MAILSALLSLVFRKLGDLVTAILGWSVTALFGRLPKTKQTALSVAILVSLVWPVLVVGIFFPQVTAIAFTFIPIKGLVAYQVVRVLWLRIPVHGANDTPIDIRHSVIWYRGV